jgi:hypothetical protein
MSTHFPFLQHLHQTGLHDPLGSSFIVDGESFEQRGRQAAPASFIHPRMKTNDFDQATASGKRR